LFEPKRRNNNTNTGQTDKATVHRVHVFVEKLHLSKGSLCGYFLAVGWYAGGCANSYAGSAISSTKYNQRISTVANEWYTM